jgi:predicted acylesterase/phospholipase RssA
MNETAEGQGTESEEVADSVPSDEFNTIVLSGGGFRATFHHLGVLLYLAATNRLTRLTSFISVSGGSVTAAYIVSKWDICRELNGFIHVAGGLVRFARTNPRDRALKGWLWTRLYPWVYLKRFNRNRTFFLRREFERLFGRETIAAICERASADGESTRLALVATDARRLQHVVFTPHEILRVRLGEMQPSDTIEGSGMLVHEAVTASACFPPVFERIRMSHKELGVRADEFQESLDVNDGGVLDNLGVFALRALGPQWHGRVLVSNAERGQTSMPGNSVFTDSAAQAFGNSQSAQEAISGIATASVSPAEFRKRAKNKLGLAFRTETMLSQYRTDFDAPSWQELNALMIHGAAVCAQSLPSHQTLDKEEVRRLVKQVLRAGGLPRKSTLPEPTESDLVRCDHRPIRHLIAHVIAFVLMVLLLISTLFTLWLNGRSLYRWAFVPARWQQVSPYEALPLVPPSTMLNIQNVARDRQRQSGLRNPEHAIYAYQWMGENMQRPSSIDLAPDAKSSFRFAISEGNQGDAHPPHKSVVSVESMVHLWVVLFPLDESAEEALRKEGIQSIIISQ